MTTKPKKRTNYINNRDLMEQVLRSKEKSEMTNELAHMLMMLCKRYASKSNFVNYTYNEDMQAFALLMLVRTWQAFDPAKSQNPFAFFTQCIKNSFIQYLNQEKRQRDIRDEALVQEGLSPSYNYQAENSSIADTTETEVIPTTEVEDNRIFVFDEENQDYTEKDTTIY